MSAIAVAELVSIEKPQLSEADVSKRSSLLEQARSIIISDQPSYDRCVEIGKAAHALTKIVNDRHAPAVSQAHALHKTLVANQKADLAPIEQAKTIAGQKIRAWDDEQTRKRLALEAEARRKAREQQEELDRQERERQAAERKRIEDERLALAEQIKADGASDAEIDSIIEQPVYIPPAPVQEVFVERVESTYEKASGVSSGGFNYSVEVVGLKELLVFALTLPASMLGQYVTANQKSLDALARSQQDAYEVPGTRLTKEPKRASFR